MPTCTRFILLRCNFPIFSISSASKASSLHYVRKGDHSRKRWSPAALCCHAFNRRCIGVNLLAVKLFLPAHVAWKKYCARNEF